ncbi:MAG: sugar nucleotide-binding protein [Nanoarchaeota archaeon]|nr:sugar nucleotide-binding protein [Nanoarchaeota archaeon]
MKGLVFGRGFLGTRIANYLGYKVIGREIADATDLSDIEKILDIEKPDVVINAIGKTGRPNIDWCETHKEETILSNVSAAVNLSSACALRGIYFVHLGSGCMYLGDKGGEGFTEDDEPNFYGPQFYAKTKILAEKAITASNPSALILRVRMPVDDHPDERNLIDKIKKYENLIDVKNSMTTVPHLLGAIKQLIEERKTGVYNLVNPGIISPFEIMEAYKKIADSSHNFGKFSLRELNQITLGTRSNCYLNTDKLKNAGITLPEIHEAVEECLLQYKEHLK